MPNVIIGTAGHVDHGKTQLVKALTGIDTDRLIEEKKRKISIELGFAYLDFNNGLRAAVIDVPGHEKFIKNMLAGAGGIDLAMLVVAADEGFMPQTVEHLSILSLLGTLKGIIVVTKTDLVDEEWLTMIKGDIRKQVAGTFLECAPIVEVSAQTGNGIPQLKALLASLVVSLPEKNTDLPFRLSVDRVFSSDGFGTIVTGTLIEGHICEGDKLSIYPSGTTARVRSLQVHNTTIKTAFAGQRVAVNVAGIKKSEIHRGDVLAKPNSLKPCLMLDVRLYVLKEVKRFIENGDLLHLYHGSYTQLCKAVLLDREKLRPGESCLAQLRLTNPLCAKAQDRFVLRFYSPIETIGGGIILNPIPSRHKRYDATVLEGLSIRESGTDEMRTYHEIVTANEKLLPTESLYQPLGMEQPDYIAHLRKLEEAGKIFSYGKNCYVADQTVARFARQLEAMVTAFHKDNPLLPGMPLNYVRTRLFPGLDTPSGIALLSLAIRACGVEQVNDLLRKTGFQIYYTQKQKVLRDLLINRYKEAGLEVPTQDEVLVTCGSKKEDCREMLSSLLTEGVLLALNDQFLLHSYCYNQLLAKAQAAWQKQGSLSLAEVRDLFGTSRKYALALLDYWDTQKLTKKVGERRVWIGESHL